MTTYMIKPNELEAIALFASTEKTRYCTNGVLIEQLKEGHAVIATDGHRLGTLRADFKNVSGEAFVLSLSDIKKAIALCKAEAKTNKGLRHLIRIKLDYTVAKIVVAIVCMEEGEHPEKELASFTTAPIDENFPDWRRAFPGESPETGDNSAGFNADYVASFGQACKLITASKIPQVNLAIGSNNGPVAVTFRGEAGAEFKGCLMPMRM